jgi:BMFP domain-containing protein YqiC
MTQTTNRILDDLARLMTDAAGAAQGVKREVDGMFRSQVQRFLSEMDVVRREEFEAVKAMAEAAREENARLAARIAALEQQLADKGVAPPNTVL